MAGSFLYTRCIGRSLYTFMNLYFENFASSTFRDFRRFAPLHVRRTRSFLTFLATDGQSEIHGDQQHSPRVYRVVVDGKTIVLIASSVSLQSADLFANRGDRFH